MPVKIDYNACVGCNNCISVCPENVYDEGDKPIIARPDNCIECSLCVDDCPEHAITIG